MAFLRFLKDQIETQFCVIFVCNLNLTLKKKSYLSALASFVFLVRGCLLLLALRSA